MALATVICVNPNCVHSAYRDPPVVYLNHFILIRDAVNTGFRNGLTWCNNCHSNGLVVITIPQNRRGLIIIDEINTPHYSGRSRAELNLNNHYLPPAIPFPFQEDNPPPQHASVLMASSAAASAVAAIPTPIIAPPPPPPNPTPRSIFGNERVVWDAMGVTLEPVSRVPRTIKSLLLQPTIFITPASPVSMSSSFGFPVHSETRGCTICYCASIESRNLAVTICGHHFCLECLIGWVNMPLYGHPSFQLHNECPTCRSNIVNGSEG